MRCGRATRPTSPPRSTSRATNNLRLVVKGGGHSYLGHLQRARFAAGLDPAMNDIAAARRVRRPGLRGQVAPQPAVTVGAGAVWIDAYDAVTTEAGRYVQGGGCTTVGVAGLDPERRLRQLLQGLRHGRVRPARGRDRHRRRRACASSTPARTRTSSGRSRAAAAAPSAWSRA